MGYLVVMEDISIRLVVCGELWRVVEELVLDLL